MTDSDIRLMALFFFYAVLDEKKAIEYASKAADVFVKKSDNLNSGQKLVESTFAVWNRYKLYLNRSNPAIAVHLKAFGLSGVQLGAWREFYLQAKPEELLSIIWSLILKIDENDIATALGIPAGTLRFRIAKGLRKLNEINRPSLVKGN